MDVNKILDFRGVECPEPLIRTLREIMRASKGNRIVVLTDQWECVDKIVSAVKFSGIGEASYETLGGHYRVEIRL